MTRFVQFLSLVLYLFLAQYGLANSPTIPAPPLTALPTLAPMIEAAGPTVVNISTSRRTQSQANPLMQDPFFRHFFNHTPMPQRQTQSAGSGVIINAKDGTIVTNHHVIKGADEIVVHFSDGVYTSASLVGSDPEVDIAVLLVEDKSMLANRAALPIGDADALRVGDYVVAIGNPFGLGQTVTTGIVSALGRSGLGIEGYENFIQTDASINPGNSGGALVNLRGELIGINTAILAPTGGNIGIGFAIPVSMMNASVAQILKHGEVKRGKIGVLIQNMSKDIAEAFNLPAFQKGVLIAQVQTGSTAESAGMKLGDIVIKIDDTPIDSATSLRNYIGLRQIGDSIKVTYLRDGVSKTTTVIIGDQRGFEMAEAQTKPKTTHSDISDTRLAGISFTEHKGIVRVQAIEPGSAGAYTGLMVGDLVETLNRTKVSSLADLKAAIKPNAALVFQIARDGQSLYLIIQK